ncbi:flavin reductase family protein [Roseomonas chloroacetimidivorans]|uniref:flavin reductase family protein n=1 Tax=Roseomonas chloroacetimidivorans TaxID=1766656 RepID=UPI003C7320EA
MDPAIFRRALGQFATGVAVMTTLGEQDAPVGVTISSFNSVSLDPPLCLFSLGRNLRSLPAFVASERCAINVLAADQHSISNRFAGRDGDKWAQTSWEPGEFGCPRIGGALACFEGTRHAIVDGGDHLIFIHRIAKVTTASGSTPLLFWGGRYREILIPTTD